VHAFHLDALAGLAADEVDDPRVPRLGQKGPDDAPLAVARVHGVLTEDDERVPVIRVDDEIEI
jgi:hypothetical protein